MTLSSPPASSSSLRLSRLLLLLSLSLLPACATSTPAPSASTAPIPNAIFYPKAPDPPRLQFLTSFSDASQWSGKHASTFSDWVVGQSPTQSASTEIGGPYGIAIHKAIIYICDVGNKCVHVIDLPKNAYRKLGQAQVRNPVHIRIDKDGTRYVCDTSAQQIFIFDSNDNYLRSITFPQHVFPIDVAILPEHLVVASVDKGELELWTKSGQFVKTLVKQGRGPDELLQPTNIELSPDNKLLVTDNLAQTIKIFDTQGKFLGNIGHPGTTPGYLARPKGVVADPQNNIYVADAQWEVVQVFQPDGKLLLFFGGPGIEPQGMGMPAGLAIDSSCLPYFQKHVDPRFQPQYLLFVINQFGKNKVGVYAYGQPKPGASFPSPSTQPSSPPPSSQPASNTP